MFVAKGVFNEIAFAGASDADFVDEQIIVQTFRRNEHKCKIHRVFVGANIFGGFINAPLQVVAHFFGVFGALGLVLGRDHAIVVFKGEFRVNRQKFALV